MISPITTTRMYLKPNPTLQTWNGVPITGSALSGLDLSGLNFQNIDFSGMNLRAACLDGTLLEHCDLHDACLAQVSTDRTVFFDCNLQGADLQGLNLSNSDLRHCDLRETTLTGVRLHPNPFWVHGVQLNSDQVFMLQLAGQLTPLHIARLVITDVG